MLMVVPQLLLQNPSPHFVITTIALSLAVFLPDTQWSVSSNWTCYALMYAHHPKDNAKQNQNLEEQRIATRSSQF